MIVKFISNFECFFLCGFPHLNPDCIFCSVFVLYKATYSRDVVLK